MRQNQLLSWVLRCVALAFVATGALAQAPARSAGRIIAARIRGPVTATNTTDKSSRSLHDNDALTDHTVVATGAGASATLVFSNGAVLNLGAESTLSIDEFLQDPFAQDVAVSDLKEEPTTSVTRLNLARGELVGNVKHLHADRGSEFTVNTPVGVAGIRGTTFRIVFRPDASGKVFFTLSTADGTVVLAQGEARQEVAVPTGKEVVVTVDADVDPQTGTITIKSPPAVESAKEMTPESQATVAAAAQQIVEDSTDVIVKATPSSNPDTSTNSGNNGPSDDPSKDDKTQTNDTTSIPDATKSSSNTSSGDGQSGT